MAVRNWRVPTRLNAILLIPVVVALIFGGFKVESDFATWQEAEDAQRTAELVESAANYGNALINERDRTAEPLLRGNQGDPVIQNSRKATDKAAREFKKAVAGMPDKPGLKRRLAAFKKVEPRLPVVRQNAYTKALPGVQTQEGYVTIQHPLMEFANELGLGTGNVTSYGRTVYAISLAKAAESLQRSLGTHLMVKPGPSAKAKQQQLTALASYAYLERIALGEYTSGGRPQDVELLKSEVAKAKEAGRKQVAAAKRKAEDKNRPFVAPPAVDKMVEEIGSGASARKLRSDGITVESWFASSTGTFEAYRAIEKNLTGHAVAETDEIASDARRDAIVNSAIVLVALLFAFIIAGRMARSMSRNMRTLRTAAFDVAEQRLPTLVDQLSRTDPGRVDTRVAPIPIKSGDEIGEVARAFDQVHREAVRLAAEQALLRGNVNAIFTNLSRRNQGLIERQLDLITDMENNEADPEQLETLFRMDHLATRMRRNGENLLVLAGEEPGRRWTEPVPLIDILRAASSEVEHYERIEVSGIPETEIHGMVVNDLVHLLAELLENATSFSSPQTKVRVTATRLPDGRLMVEIHDKGIGLTAEDFADINHKLANPPTVDAAVSQRMGLFVVGRLADQHGIRVQLRPSGEQAGTTSLVMLPDAITHGGGGAGAPGTDDGGEAAVDYTVSRVVPDAPRPGPQGPAAQGPTAAELGFDDSRYQVPDDLSSLGPVGPAAPPGRPLRRDERRAALEGRQQEYGGTGGAQQPAYSQQDQGTGLQPGGQPQFGDEGYGRQDPQGYGQNQAQGYGQGYPQGYDPAYGQVNDQQQPGRPQYDQGPYGQPPQAPQPPQPPVPQQYAQPYEPQDQQYVQRPQLPQQPTQEGQYAGHDSEAESSPGVPEGDGDRVGFPRPDSPSDSVRPTTDAGLPRREPGRSQFEGGPGAQHQAPADSPAPLAQQPQGQPSQEETGTQRPSANDERWGRAGQLRDPQAGGVTESGLPRRVPRANLVEGAAEESPQGGPSVSRAPEDVRGRLSNLHRGVRRGRTAGDANENDRQGFGPGSTYDQER